MKQHLGRKYNLSWQKFINFIKSESKRTREKLTSNICSICLYFFVYDDDVSNISI